MFKHHPVVQAMLNQRNEFVAKFWLTAPHERICFKPELVGLKVIMMDAEDTFTEMIAIKLKAIGLSVTICKTTDIKLLNDHWDLIVLGPGPGDPSNREDP